MEKDVVQKSLFDSDEMSDQKEDKRGQKQNDVASKKERKWIDEKRTKIAKAWRPFDLSEYQDLIANGLIHFSFKATNTNARAGGIRLSRNEKVSLPYVCLQTFSENVDIDFVHSREQTKLKQIQWCRDDFQEIKDAIPAKPEDVEQIAHDYSELSNSHLEIGTDAISPRLRQLLLPRNNGEYVSVTPVRSSGFCKAVKEKVLEKNKGQGGTGKSARLNLVHMGFGGSGSKPEQNLGRLARSLQTPLMFSAPRENREIKTAFSAYYNGVPTHCPANIMFRFRKWKFWLRSEYGERVPCSMKIKEHERKIVHEIAMHILARAERAREILIANQDILPGGANELVSDRISSLQKGLIDLHKRDQEWINEFGLQLARNICDFVFKDTGEKLGLSVSDVSQIEKWVKEVI